MASLALGISAKFSFYINPSNAIIPMIGHGHIIGNGINVSLKPYSAHAAHTSQFTSFVSSHEQDLKHLSWTRLAIGSGVEATISDPKGNEIVLKNVTIVVESNDEEKIQVRVDLTGEQTERAFNDVLTNLARTAPPVPGFRRTKGGKTPNVPKSFLLQALGRDRVTKFTIQEILSSTMRDYVKKENLKVKNKFNTIQTEEQLLSAFSPGSDFSITATMDIEKAESETAAANSSETTNSSS